MVKRFASERRANAARLSACLVPFVLSAAIVAPAVAAPSVPKLLGTEPGSTAEAPATSLTPLILGEAEPEDGIINKVAPFEARSVFDSVANAVEHPTTHPEYQIKIFEGAECDGALLTVGTAEALEGAGIAVGVSANAKTTISAAQVDPGTSEQSGCSNPLVYWEGNVSQEEGPSPGGGGGDGDESPAGGAGDSPTGDGSADASTGPGTSGQPSGGAVGPATPAAGSGGRPDAPHIHTDPGNRANDLTPLVVGGAPGADTVAIYASSNCGGTVVATGPASQLNSGFEVSVAANASTTFSAVASGSGHSSCSSPVTYTEDSAPPRTRITMGPGVKTRKRKAVFRFQDVTEDPPGTTFRCRVDKARWKPCRSPLRVRHLKPGRHVVTIRGTDLAGNVERRPVRRRFVVVRHAGR